MAKRQTWLEQLNRFAMPLVVVAIGLYGTWDLVIQPFIKIDQPTQVCTTTIVDVTVLKPSPQPDQPPKPVQAPAGLAIIVPAAETRLLSVEVDNPDQKPVSHQWQATYGQFASRITMGNQGDYTAPRSLVNDTVTITATLQGCSPAKRTVEFAIVPSANVPVLDQPIPNSPPTPSPTPSSPSSLPTINPFDEPAKKR